MMLVKFVTIHHKAHTTQPLASLALTSHSVPEPNGHEHRNERCPTMQMPPFWHGLCGFTSTYTTHTDTRTHTKPPCKPVSHRCYATRKANDELARAFVDACFAQRACPARIAA